MRVAKDGREVHVSISISPVRDIAGNIIGVSKIARDIGPQLASEEMIRATQGRFLALADLAPALIWMADADRRPTWFNRSWLAFTGRTLNAELAAGWISSMHPDDMAACEAAFERAQDSTVPIIREFRLRRHDGVYRWLLDRGVPLFGGDGRLTGYIGSCTDIDERKEAEADRERLLASEREARSHAERLSRVKDEFVATLSHELRTPLNAILGWSQLIRKPDAKPAAIASGLEVIERNARSQAQMIEDLLDMSRIVSGKLRLDVQRVNLLAVIEQALLSARPAAEAKGIRLSSVLDPRTNLVQGDPTRLQQIIWNLLSNAIKFTPRGGRVQVVLKRVHSSVQTVVSDSGKGINPALLDAIFERFRQEDSSTTRQFGGLGLGLAIVKQLVELHGGSVRAASEGEGKGSTFTIELPLAALHASSMPLPFDLPELAGVRVLIVDDDEDCRDLMSRILAECHATVAWASSAKEALTIFTTMRPDVILSDIGMPVDDGYTLIRTVRALPHAEGGGTPAAALTALARSEDRTRALLAGFQVHVSKPVEPSELLAVVVSLAQLHGGAPRRE